MFDKIRDPRLTSSIRPQEPGCACVITATAAAAAAAQLIHMTSSHHSVRLRHLLQPSLRYLHHIQAVL